jgi:hypothetical protein
VKLSVGAVVVRGRWVKHAYPGSLPLPERQPPPDNRWQRGDVVNALYLADSDDTAWAEWYRHLAEEPVGGKKPVVDAMGREEDGQLADDRSSMLNRPPSLRIGSPSPSASGRSSAGSREQRRDVAGVEAAAVAQRGKTVRGVARSAVIGLDRACASRRLVIENRAELGNVGRA